jgi:hypothetical protein
MPIYEYRCECGAVLESLERVGAVRERCGDLCPGEKRRAAQPLPPIGGGLLTRLLSAPGIRGDGKEAAEPTFDPVKRANRPYCDDCES